MKEAPIFAKPIASLYITTHTYFCHLPKTIVSWKWRAILNIIIIIIQNKKHLWTYKRQD